MKYLVDLWKSIKFVATKSETNGKTAL